MSRQYSRLKDYIRLQSKKGGITQEVKDRVKDFGRLRPQSEIKEEGEEQIEQRKARRDREEEGPKEEEEEKEESAQGRGRSPVRLRARSPWRLRSARQTAIKAVRPRRIEGPRSLGLNFNLNQKIKDRAKEQELANWRVEPPFQMSECSWQT